MRFISYGPERTRVELEHRNLDGPGEGWQGVRDTVGGEGGWPLYLSVPSSCSGRARTW